MADRSYLNLGDELDDRDRDEEPLRSITDREPLEDHSLEGRVDDLDDLDDPDDAMEEDALNSPSSIVKSAITSRMAQKPKISLPPNEEGDEDDPTQDPLMTQYLAKEKDLDNFRGVQAQMNLNSNVGQAAAQAAQGAMTPSTDTPLYKNMQDQGKEMLKSQEDDLHRRQQVVNAIEQRKSREGVAADNQASREGIAQSNLDARKAMMQLGQQRFDALNKSRNDRLDAANIGRANALLSNPNITKETTKLNASRSAQALMDGINSGEIKDSKNIRNQLTNIIATIELGSAGGEGDRKGMGIDNLYTRSKDLLSFLESSPNKSIPPEYLTQLQSEANALGDRAAKNYKALTDSTLSGSDLSGGDPSVEPGKIHQLVKQRRDQFLTGNGYDPSSGSRNQKETAFPKQIKKGGQIATVNSPEELREAMAEGWN